jgi:hypothetical protein
MSWVTEAEAALARGRGTSEDERVLPPRRPPVLDAEGVKAVVAPFLAGVVWAAAVFREMVAGTPIDPLALLLRLLALALTLRVVLLGGVVLRRLKVWLQARRHGLVLRPEGLLLRTPDGDRVVPRDRIVGISERGRWQERRAGRRWSEVYVAVDPALGFTHLTLPPLFDDTPGRLAERLMRWRGAPPAPEEPAHAPPVERASKLWEEAAAGRVPPGVTVVHHGWQWLRKAPYAAVLAGIAALDGLLRAGPEVWAAIDPLLGAGLVLAFLAIPLRWLWMTRREVSPRKGLSLVLTPGEVLMRTGAGILRTRWKDLARVSVDSKRKWSALEGAHDLRQLVLIRKQAQTLRYDEPYLGLPVEVGQMLLDGYRTGVLPMGEPAEG